MSIRCTQSGQTLIETIVAIFVMVMGITASLGLATYSLSVSTSISKQIIGMGLAREGVEAIKNMRDTNWLNGTYSWQQCYNFINNQATGGSCYKTWQTESFNITAGTYRLLADATQDKVWQLVPDSRNWGLDTSTNPNQGFYTINFPLNGSDPGSSGYYREIVLTEDNTPPFDKNGDIGPRLTVASRVWWTDKNCPASSNWPGAGKCSLELRTYLTNWKNYIN